MTTIRGGPTVPRYSALQRAARAATDTLLDTMALLSEGDRHCEAVIVHIDRIDRPTHVRHLRRLQERQREAYSRIRELVPEFEAAEHIKEAA